MWGKGLPIVSIKHTMIQIQFALVINQLKKFGVLIQDRLNQVGTTASKQFSGSNQLWSECFLVAFDF